MRFEIRAGGALLILIGLAGLSGAVFALGLVAGYEMARDRSGQEVATVYAVPSPPVAQVAPAMPAAVPSFAVAAPAPTAGLAALAPPLASAPVAALSPAPSASPMTAPLLPAPKLASLPAVESAVPGEKKRSAAETGAPESAAGSPSPPAPMNASAAAEQPERKAAASEPPRSQRRPYSVQIEAVMDRNAAGEMVRKLRSLGYLPYIVETDIGGQTWYRVRVGPYATEAEARAAEDKLHEQYSGAYTTRP